MIRGKQRSPVRRVLRVAVSQDYAPYLDARPGASRYSAVSENYAPLVECSTRKVLPPLAQMSTSASCPLGMLDSAFCTSAARPGLVAVDADNYLAGLKTGIVGRAARLHALDDRAVQSVRSIQLLANVGRQIADAHTPARLLVAVVGDLRVAVAAIHRLQRYRHRDRLAIAHHLQRDFGSRSHLTDFHLQLSSVGDLLAVDLRDDIANLQAGFGACGIRLDLRDHRTVRRYACRRTSHSPESHR